MASPKFALWTASEIVAFPQSQAGDLRRKSKQQKFTFLNLPESGLGVQHHVRAFARLNRWANADLW